MTTPVTGILSVSPSFGAGINAACVATLLARVIRRAGSSLGPIFPDGFEGFEGGCEEGVR